MSGLLLVQAAIFALAAAALMVCGPRRFMRGRHVSRYVVRRLGYARATAARQVTIWGGVPLLYTGQHVPYIVLTSTFAAWTIDDWLFPDDDDRKRKYEWAKVRLRMPNPVKLRPIQKWAGAPA